MATAALIIIGNEILSGRTQDKNLAWLAEKLNAQGIALREVRVVPDIASEIAEAVNALRAKHSYVFTTGGIGPTHDDITSASIAEAFGVALHRHPEAEAILRGYYSGDQLNEARLKMADTPLGATLIPNPVSAAPGFVMENVYVFAGVPRIMQAMFDCVKDQLEGGTPTRSASVTTNLTEGNIAHALGTIQHAYEDLDIGSYPVFKQGVLATTLVVRGTAQERIDACMREIHHLIDTLDGAIITTPVA
jgi:molybdenum cofactor synthesis domain-containing protein